MPYREPAPDSVREAQAEVLRSIASGLRVANARLSDGLYYTDYCALVRSLKALHDSVMGRPEDVDVTDD